MQSRLIEDLIQAFKVLPGVGAKTAQRMTYHLLDSENKPGGLRLSSKLEEVLNKVKPCEQCQNYAEASLCNICQDDRRHNGSVCVVETPTDLFAIEEAGIYKGRYFVLLGHLSPIDGIGPDELGMGKLQKQLESGEVSELILATNPTVEGEATAFYIQQLAKSNRVTVTRLAQGIPLGGELEYVDTGTLSQAFADRQKVSE